MLDLALLVVFPALMAYAAASDLVTMTIPNRLSLLLVASFAALAALGGLTMEAVLLHLAAGLATLAVTFALFALGWIGGGDAKLAAATALWLGFGTLPEYLLLASILGGVLTLVILVVRGHALPAFALRWPWVLHLHDRRTGIPYGIALAAAALVVYPHSPVWTAIVAG